jgi:hypothetical protein
VVRGHLPGPWGIALQAPLQRPNSLEAWRLAARLARDGAAVDEAPQKQVHSPQPSEHRHPVMSPLEFILSEACPKPC